MIFRLSWGWATIQRWLLDYDLTVSIQCRSVRDRWTDRQTDRQTHTHTHTDSATGTDGTATAVPPLTVVRQSCCALTSFGVRHSCQRFPVFTANNCKGKWKPTTLWIDFPHFNPRPSNLSAPGPYDLYLRGANYADTWKGISRLQHILPYAYACLSRRSLLKCSSQGLNWYNKIKHTKHTIRWKYND